MGISGSGKTTLCKILQHEIRADSETCVYYNNHILSSKYASMLKGVVASCPQDKSNIMINSSIQENIQICRQYIGKTNKYESVA